MRKLIFWLALCAGLIATPAVARDGAWYVGGEFGAMIVEDTNVDIGTVDNALRLNYDYGYDGGLFVGYDLGGFRIEAEAAYKKADLDSYTTTIRLPLEGVVFPSSRLAGGNTTAMSFMINGMLDFGDDDGISGFVGGGVGMARVKANNQRNFANATPFLDDSDSKLAWQVFAGVRQAISDNIDVTVKYRFFNVDKVRMTAWNGQEAELRFRSHSLLGGITFNFGAKPCDPPRQRNAQGQCVCPRGTEWTGIECKLIVEPCIPPLVRNDAGQCVCPDGGLPNAVGKCKPDPCDPPLVRNSAGQCVCPNLGDEYDRATNTCNPPPKVCPQGSRSDPDPPYLCREGPGLIFFGWDEREFAKPEKYPPGSKQELDARKLLKAQQDGIESAYQTFEKYGTVQILVAGHADKSGPGWYNEPLSKDRADYIRQKLIDRGVPAGVIAEPQWYSEDRPRVQTADGVREQQNRRVEIFYSGQGK